jgi:hypothetical protein
MLFSSSLCAHSWSKSFRVLPIQKNLLFLSVQKHISFVHQLMKKTAFASSALSIMSLIMGMLFLVYDIPYGYYVLAISLFLLATSLIVFYTLDKQYMYIAGAVFCFLPMAGLLFGQLNLPGADLLVTVGLVCFALFFIPWFAMKCYKD